MIKNTLYSLFLHFVLILLIYANFNLKTIPETKTNEISISLLEVKSNKNLSTAKEEIKEPVKKKPKAKPKEKPVEKVVEKSLSEVKKEEIKEIKEKEKELPQEKIEEKPEKKVEKPKEKIEKKKPEKIEEKPKEVEVPKPQEEKQNTDQNDKKEASVNNLENINLSVREKFNIQSQLKMCYKRAAIESGSEENDTIIVVTAEISRDGFIESNLEEVIDDTKYQSDKDYKVAVENVRRGIELCSPLRNLPLDKYEIWKKVLLEFGKKEENE
ncbi:MAG: hypothetical protein KGQ36_07425 [Rickettsiales bacterium]|nr:hypothetical protein [Rickettsiales bacterium]